MPLRDHFRPPTIKAASWEALHGQWPAVLVQQLRKVLPRGYVSEPRVHLGAQVEVDIAGYEKDDHDPGSNGAPAGFGADDRGGIATATAAWAPPLPDVEVEVELPDFDEYEVRVYDASRERTLVAAIEIVSPANKDRPEARNAFVGKCAALLQKGVAVTVVDLVTTRHANLYAELVAFVGLPERTFGSDPPAVYAASCRWVKIDERLVLQTWPRRLEVGRPLPALPLWLTATLGVRLDLEASYEKACDDLSIA